VVVDCSFIALAKVIPHIRPRGKGRRDPRLCQPLGGRRPCRGLRNCRRVRGAGSM
jgi:hypothetical protein